MNHPQTRAEALYKWSCLAQCYLYCAGFTNISDGQMLKMVSDAMDQGLLDEECTVKSGAYLMQFFTGKKYFVDKQKITSIENIKNPTPVFYGLNGKDGHAVVVENGKIVFNPLSYSKNVMEGKPTSARFITLTNG